MGAGASPFLAWLQHHAAGRHQVWGGFPVGDGFHCGVQRLQGLGVAQGLPHPVGGLAVGAVLQPLGPLRRVLPQQRLQIHRGRRTVLLGGFDGDGASRRRLQPEAHHGLIDGADVLHVQGAVGDALPVQNDELFQHPVNGAVRQQGRLHPFAPLPGAADLRAPAFQKAVKVRVEQGALAGRQAHGPGAGSVMHHAEQGEQLGVGAVALVHGVWVQGGILPQPLMQVR